MRAIDADKVLKIFKKWIDTKQVEGEELRAVETCIAVIEDMSILTPPNEWVSVEERLPGVSGNYICAVQDKNGSVWTIPAEWSLEMKMWIGAFGEIKNMVTHWMPLPKSPKEDE